MSLCITSWDKKRIKQIFESTHIWFKWRYFARTEKWEVRGERKRREDRLVTQKLSNPLVMSSLTYPYLDRKGSFHGCFEVINPYLNVVSIMNYQTKSGGESFDLFFFAPIMHDVFPLKTLKSISSCLSSWSGQRAKPKGVNPFIFASRFKQPPYQWTQGKAFEAERAMKGLSISITLLTCIRVVSPVQNGEMIFMLMGAGRSERGNQ